MGLVSARTASVDECFWITRDLELLPRVDVDLDDLEDFSEDDGIADERVNHVDANRYCKSMGFMLVLNGAKEQEGARLF